MNPLWIMSGLLIGCAGLLVVFLPHAKFASLWIAFFGVVFGIAAVFVWIHALIAEHDRLFAPNKLDTTKAAPLTTPAPVAAVSPAKPRTPFFQKSKLRQIMLGGGMTSAFTDDRKLQHVITVGSTDVVSGELVDGKLVLNIAFLDSNVRVTGYEVSDLPPGWDWNSDESALEIVDVNKTPMLQLEYRNENTAILRGLFNLGNHPGDKWLIATNDGMFGGPSVEELISEHPLSRIFKYPSWQFQGEHE